METTKRILSQPINNPRVVLSVVWVFVLMNMIYADILNTLKPGYIAELKAVSENIPEEGVLFFAFLMEIPIIMILLSRLLNRKANRISNFIGASLSILWVIVPSVIMEQGNTPLSYIFFATIEILSMLFIICYVWKWKSK